MSRPKGHLHYSKNFVELGWWVGDGDEWHHDEIRIDFGLVWSCFAWLCWCHCRFIVDYTVDSISCPSWYLTCLVSFRLIGESTILLGLTPAETDLVGFRNCRSDDDSTKSNKRFDLLGIQSNVQDPGSEVSRW